HRLDGLGSGAVAEVSIPPVQGSPAAVLLPGVKSRLVFREAGLELLHGEPRLGAAVVVAHPRHKAARAVVSDLLDVHQLAQLVLQRLDVARHALDHTANEEAAPPRL